MQEIQCRHEPHRTACPNGLLSHRVRKDESVGSTLRTGQPKDADAVVELWRTAGAVPTTTDDPESVRSLLVRDPEALLLAEEDGAVVASLIVGFDGWRGHLYRLAVHPQWRRRGLGRAMVEAAERSLTRRGVRRINALVVEDDPVAVAFWKAVGYPNDLHVGRHVKNLTEASLPSDD